MNFRLNALRRRWKRLPSRGQWVIVGILTLAGVGCWMPVLHRAWSLHPELSATESGGQSSPGAAVRQTAWRAIERRIASEVWLKPARPQELTRDPFAHLDDDQNTAASTAGERVPSPLLPQL